MVDWENQPRFPIACSQCGSVYVGVKLKSGEIRPVGNTSACNSCEDSKFEPLDEPFDSNE